MRPAAPVAEAADTGGREREFGGAGRMLPGLAETMAYRWGQLIGRYSRWAVRPDRIRTAGLERLPPGPIIWANWHQCNLLGGAINFHLYGADRCHAAVPPGLTGAAMRGWVGETGFEAVTLPPDGGGNPAAALKRLSRALSGGRRVVIAVDGPRGPARRVRPGALWLARLSGCPIVPTATAGRPAAFVPRWDRHVVPLPGAQVAFAVAPAFHVGKGTAIDDALCRRLGAAIDGAMRTARELVRR